MLTTLIGHYFPCRRCGAAEHCACIHDACCFCGSLEHNAPIEDHGPPPAICARCGERRELVWAPDLGHANFCDPCARAIGLARMAKRGISVPGRRANRDRSEGGAG